MDIKSKIIIVLFGLVLITIILVLNSQSMIYRDSEKIKVATTLFPYYNFAKIIGGEKAKVSLLLPPGVEAHSFEPKPSDILNINNSDIFIYTGDFMEVWAEDILTGIDNKNINIVFAADGIELLVKDRTIDPHIWLDFDNSKKIADNILKAFLDKDSENSDFYIKNADELKINLSSLDNEFKTDLLNCHKNTLVYGGHYAFGYLVEKYNLNYFAAQGLAPDSEPTAKDLFDLINQIKNNSIKYIFYEELSSPKIAETISSETGAELLFLNPAHNVGEEDVASDVSFIDIMRRNLENIKIGLECQ